MDSFSNRIDEDDDAMIILSNVEQLNEVPAVHDNTTNHDIMADNDVIAENDVNERHLNDNTVSCSSSSSSAVVDKDASPTSRPRSATRKPFYEPPEFIQRLNVFEEVELGAQIVFECQCRAFPRAVSRWFLDDVEITCTDPTARVSVDHSAEASDGVLRLVVKEARKSDEGAYKCKSENQEGVASTTGYLSITGASIASSTTSSNGSSSSSPRSEHAVSSPPLLRAITEQSSMEEREAASSAYEDEISPFQQFIENVERGSATGWPYAELDFLRADDQPLVTDTAAVAGLGGLASNLTGMDDSATAAGVDFEIINTPNVLGISYLPHSLEDWGSDQSLEHVSEYPSNSSIDRSPSWNEERKDVSRTSRPVHDSTEHTPTPEGRPETSVYLHPSSSSPAFSDTNNTAVEHSASSDSLDIPSRNGRFSSSNSANNSLTNDRPMSGGNRTRGLYATSIDDMDKSNFFVEIARSGADTGRLIENEEMLLGGGSSENKNNGEMLRPETNYSNHIQTNGNDVGREKIKQDEELFKSSDKSPTKLPLEAGNKMLSLFFSSTKKKDDVVSKNNLVGESEKSPVGVRVSDSSATTTKIATQNNPKNSFELLPGLGANLTQGREKVKEEPPHKAEEHRITSNLVGSTNTTFQSVQSEHPGSPSALASSTTPAIDANATRNEPMKSRLENSSKHFKLPKFFETTPKVVSPSSTEDHRLASPHPYLGVAGLPVSQEDSPKRKMVDRKSERKAQEFDLFEALDWCVQWSAYPWNCYVGFAFLIAIYASFLQLNPAVVILIVGLVSAATFEFLIPKANPTYQETEI